MRLIRLARACTLPIVWIAMGCGDGEDPAPTPCADCVELASGDDADWGNSVTVAGGFVYWTSSPSWYEPDGSVRRVPVEGGPVDQAAQDPEPARVVARLGAVMLAPVADAVVQAETERVVMHGPAHGLGASGTKSGDTVPPRRQEWLKPLG